LAIGRFRTPISKIISDPINAKPYYKTIQKLSQLILRQIIFSDLDNLDCADETVQFILKLQLKKVVSIDINFLRRSKE